MNIAFDAYAILGPMSKNRGIGNYALSQFVTMINRDSDNKYFFLNMVDEEFVLHDFVSGIYEFQEDFVYTGKENVLLRLPVCSEMIGKLIKDYINKNAIDIFYITSPFESNFIPYKKDWFSNTRVVATVYDIIPYVMKEHYLRDKNTFDWYMKCIDNLRWVDEILVISQSVKDDLVNYLGFQEEKIKVIWGAVDDRYKKIDISDSDKETLFRKFGIDKPFVMCTGGDDVRKNLDGLIRAFSLLPNNIKNEYQLVVVCKLSKNTKNQLFNLAKECQIDDCVVFTDFVTNEELVQFYNLATLMAFPSKYEGFGLPIVEAWACGTPVLTSNNSSLEQIGGDAAVLVDANDDQSIADGMKKILQEETTLIEYTQKGEKRLELYQWERIADLAIGFLSQVPTKDIVIDDKQESYKIAMFTPLPPIESGISDYSEDIITALCTYCDIDVYIDDGYETTMNLPENVRVFHYSKYDIKHTEYHDTVYQMGNSEYHFYMYPYIQKYRGTLVLHDYNLHGAIYHYAINQRGNYRIYNKMICEDVLKQEADAYVKELKNATTGPRIYEMELNGIVTNYADRIIVHSKDAKKKLLKKDISRNVEVLASYAKIEPIVEKDFVKIQNGYNKNDTIIAAFGGVHETKRVVPILKAFSILKEEFGNVKLLFVGKLADSVRDEFNSIIAEKQLKEVVKVTGYIELDRFRNYIDMTDICLNLRYPYNGETSGSLMRILAKGKCVVVNDIGSFGEIPSEVCVKLPSVDMMGEDNEIHEIHGVLKQLIENPENRHQLEVNARMFAEENLDIRIVAKRLHDIISSEKGCGIIDNNLLSQIRKSDWYSENDAEQLSKVLAFVEFSANLLC